MVSKLKIKIALSFASILISPVVIFSALECMARWSELPQFLNFQTDSKPVNCSNATKSSYRLSVDFSHQQKTKYLSEEITYKKLVKNYDYIYTNELGYPVHKENQNFQQRATVIETGETAYDVKYSFDERGRRKVPGADKIFANSHLAISGCSVVFGEGLEDEQTLPAQLQKKVQKTKVYNLGRAGGSVVDAISTMQVTNLWKDIDPKEGALLFFHSSQTHVPRFLGTISTVGVWNNYGAFLNEEAATGAFQYGGVYDRNRPIWTLLSRWATRSQFLKRINFDWPPTTNSALEAYVRALSFLQQQYQLITDAKNPMVVYFRPGEKDSCKIIPYLEKYKIYYLDYSDFEMKRYATRPLKIQYDAHPTEEFNRILSQQLMHDLTFHENTQKIQRTFF